MVPPMLMTTVTRHRTRKNKQESSPTSSVRWYNTLYALPTRMVHTKYKTLHKKIIPLSCKASVSLKRTLNLEELLVGEGLAGLDSSGHGLFFKMEMSPSEGKVYRKINRRYPLNTVHPSSFARVCSTPTDQEQEIRKTLRWLIRVTTWGQYEQQFIVYSSWQLMPGLQPFFNVCFSILDIIINAAN